MNRDSVDRIIYFHFKNKCVDPHVSKIADEPCQNWTPKTKLVAASTNHHLLRQYHFILNFQLLYKTSVKNFQGQSTDHANETTGDSVVVIPAIRRSFD